MKTQVINRRSFLGQFLAGAALGLAGPQIVTHGLRLAAKVRPSGLSEVTYCVFDLGAPELAMYWSRSEMIKSGLAGVAANPSITYWKNL